MAIVANSGDEGTIRNMSLRWSRSESIGRVLIRLWRGDKELELVCERIAALKDRFGTFASSWREFRPHEKLLHERSTEGK